LTEFVVTPCFVAKAALRNFFGPRRRSIRRLGANNSDLRFIPEPLRIARFDGLDIDAPTLRFS
jgi:hypothetical protein